jgi:UDP-2-acetamido-3-amino-2,3-dideoxy-glucuronate N-acetyltransferase
MRQPAAQNTAVVGCGGWGKNLVRALSQLGALTAIHDVNPNTVKALSDQYHVPARSFEAILLDVEIPAVVIAAPAEMHGTLALRALEAGKHVLVEKPLALDIATAERLCELADQAGRVLMVGHLLQYHPGFLKLKEILDEGRLGRLLYIYSNRLNLGKIRREENILWSFAPHDISMVLALAGAEPLEVSAIGACYLHKAIADTTMTHLRFASGINAHVYVSWLHPFKEQKLVVIGEAGMAVFDDQRGWGEKLQVYMHRIDWRKGAPVPMAAEPTPVPIEAAEPLILECGHFLGAVASGSRPRTDGHEGLRVLRVLDAAERSMRKTAFSEAPASGFGARSGAKPFFAHETAVLDEGCEVGEGTKIWHFSHILPKVRIGRRVNIGQNVMIGPDVTVGDGCKIQNNVSLYKGVHLEEGVFCGPSCVFTNVKYPRAEVNRSEEFASTYVERGATIGANATIVCGTRLGRYCFVAAGAMVSKDVPAFALMAGVPARRIGWVGRSGEVLGPDLVCPRTGERYRETGPDQLEEMTA